jgi:hypothetical protein
MIPPAENRAFDRSILTRMMKAVAAMLARDAMFASVCSEVLTMESGDILAKFRQMLNNKMTVAVQFDTFIPVDVHVWAARISVRIGENVMLNRAENNNQITAGQLAESTVAILHQENIVGDQDNWGKLICKQVKFEGFDDANNLLIYSVDVQATIRAVATTIEES